MKIKDTPKVEMVKKNCSICGKTIPVQLFPSGKYIGGNYFCKIPLCTDEEEEKSRKAGTTKERFGNYVFEVCNKDPKPYAFAEYWECDKCYSLPDTKIPS
ncbi:hypothetical protein A2215_03175 [Candidatus Berkelbacteria bacterium RIFOXYA2_FULL_43_10]|uniref:Uncharacterized protein n=1 Tax=Candidatus Berkelbacteria bacterium RIFOXYA2_FULL_43_10 TaxID=1797472 RepID=A0A1F5EE14_9BACT|nr:MAG: hypothetical protein A2215_03175 [Candidatus Berkelbacteria bacterium RIFOXYA2_FULL_43_10]